MKATLDTNDRQFLRRLHRLGEATVQDLCDDMGVTATAVRQRLSRLQALGLASRNLIRSGRGRPHHAYCVTENGLRELGDNYAALATILWKELRSIDDAAVRTRVFDRVEKALVSEYGPVVRGDSVGERLKQLTAVLDDRGFDVELDTTGSLPILRENNCPYMELSSIDSGICELEQAVFGRVLGAEVKLTQCCHDGHTCCEFQLESTK